MTRSPADPDWETEFQRWLEVKDGKLYSLRRADPHAREEVSPFAQVRQTGTWQTVCSGSRECYSYRTQSFAAAWTV
jgi:hypothetical protein